MESNSEVSEDKLLSIDSDIKLEANNRQHSNVGESSAEETTNTVSACQHPAVKEEEVTLSDDEEEPNAAVDGEENLQISGNNNASDDTSPRYDLRRKRKVNYSEMENSSDEDDAANHNRSDKKTLKKQVLDIFAVSTARILTYIQNPDLIDSFNKCKMVYLDGTDSGKIATVGNFFNKCGAQFEDLFILTRYDLDNFRIFRKVLKNTTALESLTFKYHSSDDAYHLLSLLMTLINDSHLQALHSIKLTSVSGKESLKEKHLKLIAEYPIKLRKLELGDALWDDVKCETLQKLLKNQKASLETLIIHGGFRGDSTKQRLVLTIPKMEALTKLSICPNYVFLSEFKNPNKAKKKRMINVDSKTEEPIKIAIKFETDLPNLKRLVLGNLIDIDDLLFSQLRRLSEFRCGSHWNLSISFPNENSRKALLESSVTEFQFPDALKDPTFVVKVAKHFPNLKKVWMFLPSVPVLRAFFKAFETSGLEELHLKTQFDFESTMESCLLPNLSDVLRKSKATETLLKTLKEYKHFDEYVKYYNVELPVKVDDLMESHSAGIGALRNLKVLHLWHIPRKLLIPIPDEERKWYDHNCKFMSSKTLGYYVYPLDHRCHKEIMQLDLSEYTWRNIQINSGEFCEAGFKYFNVDSDEDIFEPVRRSKGTHVKVLPSMLFPDVKVKPEGM